MLELDIKKRRLIEMVGIPAKPEFLKQVYEWLCLQEGVKPIKDYAFSVDIDTEGFFDVEVKTWFWGLFVYKRKYKMRLKPQVHWIVVLIHEFTHQLRYKDSKETNHNKDFYSLNEYLLNMYFDNIVVAFNRSDN